MSNTTKTHAMDMSALGRSQQELNMDKESIALEVPDLSLFYDTKQALHNVSMRIPRNRVTAFIGPSGCGKSTLLRCFNRMNDLVDSCRVDGEILLDGKNIYGKDVNVTELRRRVGMVFQKPTPFPMSIYENIAFGVRLYERISKDEMDERVERALRRSRRSKA